MRRFHASLATGVAIFAVAVFALGSPAQAAAPSTGKSDRGPKGNSITVSKVKGLNPSGDRVIVTGHGFSPSVGIYVAFCVTPLAGQRPDPCGGGVNMSGNNPASIWISSNPPAYGVGLAKPYGAGGSFRVSLSVAAAFSGVDCRRVSCSVVTRADHLRSNDRTWDLAVPVRFR